MSIADVMTPDPVTLDVKGTAADAAAVMRGRDIGDVIVRDGERVAGIVTDRDIVVRVVAENRDPTSVDLGEFCTRELLTLLPEDSVSDAIELMSERAVRRLPVVDADGRPVGIVSLGDLALERDRESVLGQISAAPPND